MTLDCPCCGQPTSHPGAFLNALVGARARLFDIIEHIRSIPPSQPERIALFQSYLEKCKARVAELESYGQHQG